jgi:alkyldihydroxyacetonephosphate synthase
VLGAGEGRTLLLMAASGSPRDVARTLDLAREIARGRKGGGAIAAPSAVAHAWWKSRFRAPYLRNTLWEAGYAVDTLETATSWERVPALVLAVEASLRGALGDEERVHVFTHLSHCYPTGSSAYTTYLFRVADPDLTLARWRKLKAAASEAIVRAGGTISHQHGIGTDHLPYLEAEKGPLGIAATRSALASFDPDGILNPGKLLP